MVIAWWNVIEHSKFIDYFFVRRNTFHFFTLLLNDLHLIPTKSPSLSFLTATPKHPQASSAYFRNVLWTSFDNNPLDYDTFGTDISSSVFASGSKFCIALRVAVFFCFKEYDFPNSSSNIMSCNILLFVGIKRRQQIFDTISQSDISSLKGDQNKRLK